MSQQYPEIDRLIGLYLTGRLSPCDRQELEQWLHSSSANREVFEQLKEIWTMPSSNLYHSKMDREKERIWAAGTNQQEKFGYSGNGDLWKWGKIAAMLFFFITGLGLYFFSIEGKYSTTASIAMVEKFNPAGQKSQHRLPDGTLVWLNAESRLVYPENFSDTLRQVHLIGEAYFEVAQEQQKPFIVEASGTVTRALGTAFNIQSYPENPIIKIALLEGKIEVKKVRNKHEVKSIILVPGEELQAPKDDSEYTRQQFKFENTFGWKNGLLVFDGADFSSFRSTIEKWYGVQVEVKGTAPDDWSLRARYQSEVLQHVLQDVSFNKNLKFEVKDKNVLLIF